MVRVNPSIKSNAETGKHRSPRVKAEFPVQTLDGSKGQTQDISATGIFMDLDQKQKVGSIISFWVELNTAGVKMKLVCEAKVVRVQEEGGKTKLGAEIISQELQAINE